MSYDFYKTYEGDAVFYWYDITSHIQRIFGEDIVEKARVCLGHGYKDDSEDEIERLYCKLECSVRDIELKMNKSLYVRVLHLLSIRQVVIQCIYQKSIGYIKKTHILIY